MHLAFLEDAQLSLEKFSGKMRSLSPEKKYATPLPELFEKIIDDEHPDLFVETFARGLAALALAQTVNFPRTIFQDLDFIAADVYRQAVEAPAPIEHLEELFAILIGLQRLYGCQSSLNFQYVHDFTYGFDWVRWVAKSPRIRRKCSPFHIGFLYYLQRRAGEIRALIRQDDKKYPRLAAGEARNPFGFSRTPPDEISLHETLAREGGIPVEAWAIDGRVSQDFRLYENRFDRAIALGLGLKERV